MTEPSAGLGRAFEPVRKRSECAARAAYRRDRNRDPITISDVVRSRRKGQ
jgi:hypothetical protein